MFGSVMLDVAIGLILVYLILSLACTALRELFEMFLKNRAGFLHQGILELLHDPALTKDLYEHPLINSLYHSPYTEAQKNGELPSYIPSRSFALAVLDMAARGRDTASAGAAGIGAPVMSIATIRQNISLLGNSKVQRVILSAIDTSKGELSNVQQAIETWFNSSMDRVSGWYKRRSQLILIVLGVAIAGVVNVDTMRLAVSFYKDPSQRQAAVAMAGSFVKEPPAGTAQPTPGTAGATPVQSATAADAATLFTKLDSLSLPIGWPDPGFGLMRIFGWLLTALAVSLGAPFWFDLLSKFMTVRSTLKPKTPAPAGDQSSGTDSSVTIVPRPAAAVPSSVAMPVGASAPGASGPGGPGADYQPHAWASGHGQEGVI